MREADLARLLHAHGWRVVEGTTWPDDTVATCEEEYELPAPEVVHKRRRRVPQAGPGLFDGAAEVRAHA